MKSKILIIDDEKGILESLSGILQDEGFGVEVAERAKAGIDKFKSIEFDVVLLDVWMPEMDGITALQKLKEYNPRTPVIIMSGHGNVETAVKATKLGAYDFLEKPLSIEVVLPKIRQAMKSETKQIAAVAQSGADFIGESKVIQDIKRQINLVAPKDAWVLLSGENGTGKEVVAKTIHDLSKRSKESFVAVNCAAIPEELIESELFGHVKGAFTNAISDKVGKFEKANKGILFLDEIADMSLKTQAKILRILQEQQFEKLGDVTSKQVNVRVIAASNKDLKQEIEAGRFREDLYYRLNVVPFEIPPLRDRVGDIELLAEFFLEKISIKLDEPKKSISVAAMKKLASFHWPGNVRELQNLIERLCVLVEGSVIEVQDLPKNIHGEASPVSLGLGDAQSLKEARSDFEKAFIEDSLQKHGWNISKTAESIGVERSNLHRKIKSYGIEMKQTKENT